MQLQTSKQRTFVVLTSFVFSSRSSMQSNNSCPRFAKWQERSQSSFDQVARDKPEAANLVTAGGAQVSYRQASN